MNLDDNNAWVVIPAYNPDEKLISLVTNLQETINTQILIINDGSDESCQDIFERLKPNPHVKILTHAVNRGKGQALKTAINYYLLNAPEKNPGLITADADGQHLVEDIIKVMHTGSFKKSVVLGSRAFDKDIPMRSLIGNKLTKQLFYFFTGYKISDTQTGLRFFPKTILSNLLAIPYDRYEYEFAVLVHLAKNNETILEETISTVYLNDNKSSHFNPLLDSIAIYSVFLRFTSVSIVTALIDYIVFSISYLAGTSILGSFIFARLIAGSFNFFTVRRLVFFARSDVYIQILKYITLTITLMIISWGFTEVVNKVLGGYVLAAKLFAESSLFFCSFAIQRFLIFKK